MADEHEKTLVYIDQIKDFEFRVKFGTAQNGEITIDEPAPIGSGAGPSPSRMLAAAVGGCLSASLLFCSRKMRLDVQGLRAEVAINHERNERGRLRIGKIDVEIEPTFGEKDEQKLKRCLELYEDFCVVTQSVRNGIDVSVKVKS
jgi:uncharacterized OsmC-like protein